MWQLAREQAIFLGAGRALLLQLAHPWVSTGICEHSRTLADPIDRFHRTFNVIFTMVFGSLNQALGPYLAAKARLSGKGGPDLLTIIANRLWIGQPRMGRAVP
jgi:hypothetical protein